MPMPPKQLQKQPRFISIEGNIGSGKSTILRIIREAFPELTILDEPLSEWQHVGENKDINLLEMYYKSPTRWGFTFQIYAFMTRLKKWGEYSKFDGQGFHVSERSLLSDRYIFASIMHDMLLLDEAEYLIYLQCYDHLAKMQNIVELSSIIYVQCAPEVCAVRIKNRCREGEEGIPVDYLERIHEKHQKWLVKEAKPGEVLVLDNSQSIDKENIVKKIANWIGATKLM